jgi:hypothetical protein
MVGAFAPELAGRFDRAVDRSLGFLMVNAVGAFPAEPAKSVRLLLPSPTNAAVQQIGSVLTRQIQQPDLKRPLRS